MEWTAVKDCCPGYGVHLFVSSTYQYQRTVSAWILHSQNLRREPDHSCMAVAPAVPTTFSEVARCLDSDRPNCP